MYLNSENWLKASVEFENENFQHLGSVVTNHGHSIGQPRKFPHTKKQCGIASADGRTIIVSNVPVTESIFHKCESAICGKAPEPSDSESTHAVRKTPVSQLFLQTWNLQIVNGWHITDNNRTNKTISRIKKNTFLTSFNISKEDKVHNLSPFDISLLYIPHSNQSAKNNLL